MKIFRWLFSNLFLILLIVAVIYSYMFWGNLTGSDTPAGKAVAYLSSEFVEVEEFINAVKSKQQAIQSDRDNDSSEQVSSSADDLAKDSLFSAEAEETAVIVEKQERGLRAAPIPIQETATSADQQIPQQESASAITAPESDVAGSKDIFISAEVEGQLDNVDKHGNVIDASRQEGEIRNTWVTARKSYYQRNYSLAEQSYLKVIDNTKDNFDAYGELGNVYFNQGKKEQAAAVYYEAAAILVRKGQVNRARSLTGLLRHLDKEKAEALQGLIDSAISKKESKS